MLFRSAEVVSVLMLVVALIIAKHLPIFDALPLSQITGIVCFMFAIYLSLRIYNAELKKIRAEE
jgi:hypothetical protein